MPGKRAGRVRQEAAAGRDAYIARRDQFIINIDAAGLGRPPVPGLLPRDVPGFTGRVVELDRLTVLAAGGSVVVTAIGGTAGVGKTALAIHAAHRLLPEFPDGQLYADLRGYTAGQPPADPGEVLEVFLRRLGVPGEEVPAGTEERSGLLRQLLASRRVLMLLDNARSEAQVRPLLADTGRSLVLITSRSVLPCLEVNERIGLDVLSADDAEALLAGLIGADRATAEPDAVGQVRDWCGCLPLALRIAGQLLAANPAWPVAKLAKLLAGEQDRLEQLTAGDLQVRAAFAVSYQQLEESDARTFRLLGLHPGPDYSVAAAASLAGIDPGEAAPVLDRLVLAHLVTEDGAGRFGMHDLLRLFARATCQDSDDQATRDAAEARLVRHYTELAGFLDSCVNPQLRRTVAQAAEQARVPLPSMREALAMFEAERPSLLAAVGLAAQRGWDEHIGQLSDRMDGSLTLMRYLDDLLTVREAALAAARRAGDTPAEGRALGNLGNAYQELRRFEEAIGCYQESLAIRRQIGDHYDEATILSNLGLVYRELRRFEEAIACCQESLAIRRETGDMHGEGTALNNLGGAFGDLRRFEEAIGCYRESLTIFRETGDMHGEGAALNNLGDAYRELRRFEKAIGCHRESLTIFRETGDRYREGWTLSNLGGAYRELRRFEEAIGCHRESLTIFCETGDRHRQGQALHNLGDAYQDLRQFEEAIGCYQDSLAIRRETGNRGGEGLTLNNLGLVYWELRRFEEAIGCFQQSLAIRRETGDRHGEGLTLNNLGGAYQGLRLFEEAIGCFQQSLAICQETGDRHGEGTALNNLGLAYWELRQPDQAAVCWRDAAAAMRNAGDHEAAARLERAANADSRRRRLRRLTG